MTDTVHHAQRLLAGRELLGQLWPVERIVVFGKMVIHPAEGFEQPHWLWSHLTQLAESESVGQRETLAEGRLSSGAEYEADAVVAL